MALPQPEPGSDWTTETLRQHLLELLAALGKHIDDVDLRNQQRHEAQTLAVGAAVDTWRRVVDQTQTRIEQAIELNERRYQERFDTISKAQDALLTTLHESNARIAEQVQALATHAAVDEAVKETVTRVAAKAEALDRLTDSKFITLRTLVDSQAEKVALALTASDKAVAKAELASDKRFEGVNEFREQLRDQAATLMPRSEAEQRIASTAAMLQDVNKRLDEMAARIDRNEGQAMGRGDSSRNFATVAGLVFAFITVVVSIYLATH